MYHSLEVQIGKPGENLGQFTENIEEEKVECS